METESEEFPFFLHHSLFSWLLFTLILSLFTLFLTVYLLSYSVSPLLSHPILSFFTWYQSFKLLSLTKASVNLFHSQFIFIWVWYNLFSSGPKVFQEGRTQDQPSRQGVYKSKPQEPFSKLSQFSLSLIFFEDSWAHSIIQWSIVLQSCPISFLMSNMVKKPLENEWLWSGLPSKALKMPCPSGSLSLSKKRASKKVAPLKHEDRRSLWCDGYKKEVMYLRKKKLEFNSTSQIQ